MNAPLPGPLADNPSLDRWVSFPSSGKVGIFTGRVELGQGVLTAMAQIAADELDVAMARIVLRSGDTELTPNEGYTAGSHRIQFGGVAMRQACADVRALFLDQAAKIIGCAPDELSVRDGAILRKGTATGQDYWTLAGAVNLAVKATGSGPRKPVADMSLIGVSSERLDLPDKIFGNAIFIHDMRLPGMVHARVVRQPNRGATIDAVDEKAILRAAKTPVQFVRHGNFLAILGDDETAVYGGYRRGRSCQLAECRSPTATQQEANWLLQRPAVDRVFGASDEGNPQGRQRFEATYTRGYLAHASISPSCGLAEYRDGHLTVWTHCQGVYPLRAALAKTLGLEASAITVHHVQGSGCYGHNGADDAAADAAIIAMRMPGKPVRVRWRREEEFVYEPKTPAMIVKVRALVDDAGKPVDWTQEIWSPTHNHRPGAGGNLLGALALPNPPPEPPPNDVPESNGGGATRNGEPLYDIAAKRILHHLVTETPVRTSALRGLGAMPNVFALECGIDEFGRARRQGPGRLSAVDHRRQTRARGDREGRRHGAVGRQGARRHRPRPRHCLCALQEPGRLLRRGRRARVVEEIRLAHVWCATDAGLVIDPDGAISLSKAASFSRQAGCSRNRSASTTASH